MGVARGGGEGEGWGSSPTLPPCGQLTRCFSAVAELLVFDNNKVRTYTVYNSGTYFGFESYVRILTYLFWRTFRT